MLVFVKVMTVSGLFIEIDIVKGDAESREKWLLITGYGAVIGNSNLNS